MPVKCLLYVAKGIAVPGFILPLLAAGLIIAAALDLYRQRDSRKSKRKHAAHGDDARRGQPGA